MVGGVSSTSGDGGVLSSSVGGGGWLSILGSIGGGGGWLGILGGGGSLISSVGSSSRSNCVLLGGDTCGGDSSEWVAGNSVDLNFPAGHRVEY